MKLVFYMANGLPHHKNWHGIQLMCKSCNIEFEYTNDIQRIRENNYDILYCMCSFIDPYSIPSNIKIFYGPQLWVIPEKPVVGPFDEKLKGRCVFNSLSQWVQDFYLELCRECIMPIGHFPLAVDIDAFKPLDSPAEKEYDCIVYVKARFNTVINHAISLLNEKGLKFRIFTYGGYNEQDYMYALHRSKFMLTLDASESQGFALQEAMSCDVPLLVMDCTSMYDASAADGATPIYAHLRPHKLLSTSVPYWSDECGIKITEQEELSATIDKMMETCQTFTPRDYIVRTLSAEVCMKRMLDYFGLPMP